MNIFNSKRFVLIRFFCCVFFLIFSFTKIFAQRTQVDILKSELPSAKDSFQYIDILNRIGTLYHLENQDSVFYYTKRSYALAKKMNYKKGIADALNNFGIACLGNDDRYLAMNYYNDANKIYTELKDTSNECQTLMNIGVVLTSDNKIKEGLGYLNRAYNLLKQTTHDSILSLDIYNIITSTSYNNNQYIYNQQFFEEGYAVAKKYKDERMLILYNEITAYYLKDSSKLDEAINLVKCANDTAEMLGFSYLKTYLYLDLGDFYLDKFSDSSAEYYSLALSEAQKGNFIISEIATSQKLYAYYLAKHDEENTKKYAALLMNFYQKNLQQIKQEGISYSDFAAKNKELENAKQQEIYHRKTIIILIISSAAFLCMLFFSYRAYLSRKKHSKALEVINQTIETKNKVLESSNNFKSSLVSVLAHDFKQPLIDVQNLITIFRSGADLSQEDLNKALSTIEASSKSSIENFDTILEWIRKQLLGFNYDPRQLSLNKLINDIIINFQSQITEHRLSIKNNISADAFIKADTEMLQFVNRNFIHNAIKFSNNGASIFIDAKIINSEIIVSVKDQGEGITQDKIASLFNFVKERRYTNNKEKGAGIAMVICKDFIKKMNGRIWAESNLDNGSCFFYALPLQ